MVRLALGLEPRDVGTKLRRVGRHPRDRSELHGCVLVERRASARASVVRSAGCRRARKDPARLRSSEALRLYLTEPQEQRYLVRDIPLASGLDELGRERAAQVVLASALAFLARRASTPWPEVERAFTEPERARVP